MLKYCAFVFLVLYTAFLTTNVRGDEPINVVPDLESLSHVFNLDEIGVLKDYILKPEIDLNDIIGMLDCIKQGHCEQSSFELSIDLFVETDGSSATITFSGDADRNVGKWSIDDTFATRQSHKGLSANGNGDFANFDEAIAISIAQLQIRSDLGYKIKVLGKDGYYTSHQIKFWNLEGIEISFYFDRTSAPIIDVREYLTREIKIQNQKTGLSVTVNAARSIYDTSNSFWVTAYSLYRDPKVLAAATISTMIFNQIEPGK